MKNLIFTVEKVSSCVIFYEQIKTITPRRYDMLEKLQGPWLQPGETLVCLGDSLTAANPGYMKELTEKLTAAGVNVINAGVPGDKTPAALTRLDSSIGVHKPDAVSIFLGANDAAVGRDIWADEPIVPPEAYRSNLQWIIHLLRLRYNVKKFSIATPLWRFEGSTYAMHGNILESYCLMARDAADQMRTLLVPLDVEWEKAVAKNENRRDPESGMLLTCDGTHPTHEGYQIIADAFLKYWQMN